jgi:rhamnose transport system ATP-binding protein
VELEDIWRSFGGVRALKGVSLTIRGGEVLGLVGENGAGKSTLVKILTGVLEPDRGRVLVDGQPQRISNPRAARQFGIAATYQEPVVFPDLDVAENVFAGRQPTQRGVIAWGEIYAETAMALDELGIQLDPHRPVYQLGIADRQMIEIARSLSVRRTGTDPRRTDCRAFQPGDRQVVRPTRLASIAGSSAGVH